MQRQTYPPPNEAHGFGAHGCWIGICGMQGGCIGMHGWACCTGWGTGTGYGWGTGTGTGMHCGGPGTGTGTGHGCGTGTGHGWGTGTGIC